MMNDRIHAAVVEGSESDWRTAAVAAIEAMPLEADQPTREDRVTHVSETIGQVLAHAGELAVAYEVDRQEAGVIYSFRALVIDPEKPLVLRESRYHAGVDIQEEYGVAINPAVKVYGPSGYTEAGSDRTILFDEKTTEIQSVPRVSIAKRDIDAEFIRGFASPIQLAIGSKAVGAMFDTLAARTPEEQRRSLGGVAAQIGILAHEHGAEVPVVTQFSKELLGAKLHLAQERMGIRQVVSSLLQMSSHLLEDRLRTLQVDVLSQQNTATHGDISLPGIAAYIGKSEPLLALDEIDAQLLYIQQDVQRLERREHRLSVVQGVLTDMDRKSRSL